MRRRAITVLVLLLPVACTPTSDRPAHRASGPPRSSPRIHRSSTTGPTTKPSNGYELTQFMNDLSDVGHHIRIVGTNVGGDGVLGIPPTILCVDRELIHVYAYASDQARADHSDGIGASGSDIRTGTRAVMVDWVGPPHFFARGRIIVLYLGHTHSVLAQLTHLLGTTLSPKAIGRTNHEHPC